MSYFIGKSILDYLHSGKEAHIITLNSLGVHESVPVSYFFRSFDAMPQLEQEALDRAEGRVLDIGAGAGSHSLVLQSRDHDVTAIDVSEDALACCRKRGVRKTACSRIQDYKGGPYDTLLLLMNGIGVAGSLKNLDALLHHLNSLMHEDGQILLDSSDIRYMYADDDPSLLPSNAADSYYGNIRFSVYYQGEYEPPFPWVYVDFERLKISAKRSGLKAEKILDGPHFDYLARLTLK